MELIYTLSNLQLVQSRRAQITEPRWLHRETTNPQSSGKRQEARVCSLRDVHIAVLLLIVDNVCSAPVVTGWLLRLLVILLKSWLGKLLVMPRLLRKSGFPQVSSVTHVYL